MGPFDISLILKNVVREANEEFNFGHIDILAFLEKFKGIIEYRIAFEILVWSSEKWSRFKIYISSNLYHAGLLNAICLWCIFQGGGVWEHVCECMFVYIYTYRCLLHKNIYAHLIHNSYLYNIIQHKIHCKALYIYLYIYIHMSKTTFCSIYCWPLRIGSLCTIISLSQWAWGCTVLSCPFHVLFFVLVCLLFLSFSLSCGTLFFYLIANQDRQVL